LTRVKYQGFPVFRCDQCCGYLVSRQRMESLKHLWRRPLEQLKQEVLSETQEDAEMPVRCPICRARMSKHWVKPPASFHLDSCQACHVVWLDGGELARLQLAQRASWQGCEAAELQRRWREMSPQRRAEFERNLARLPESLPEHDTAEGGWEEALLELLFRLAI